MPWTRLVVFLFLLILPACKFLGSGTTESPQGNAEGYGGRKIFYWIDPYYQCTRQDGTSIASYRGRIEFAADSSITAFGDECSNSTETVNQSDLDFSTKPEILGYKEGIYEQRTTPPDPGATAQDYAIALCFNVEPVAGSLDFVVESVGDPPQLNAHLYRRQIAGYQDVENIRIGSTLRDGVRWFASMDEQKFLAGLRLDSPNPNGFGLLGRMIYRSDTEIRQDIHCRLAKAVR